MNLWQALKQRMLLYGDKIALHDAGLTYGQVIAEVERSAKAYTSKGKLLPVCRQDKTQQAIEMLAIFCSGNVAVPLSDQYGDTARIAALIKEDTQTYPEAAICAFSSGTSGTPKGILLGHTGIWQNIVAIDHDFPIENHDKLLIMRPLRHISAITGELLLGLYKGASIGFYQDGFQPKRLLRILQEGEYTVLCTTPTVLQHCARVHTGDLTLRKCCISGEILTEERANYIAQKFPGVDFYNGYGLTENSPRVSISRPEEFLSKAGSVGKGLPGTEMRIAAGELLVRSSSKMLGYYQDDQRTKKAFLGEWLRTGDRAHMDQDGCFYIDGRMDNLIIRAGVNIYPEDIEKVLQNMKGVQDCFVLGEPDPVQGQRVVAWVAGKVERKAVQQYAIRNLPQYMIPSIYHICSTLPIGPGGKLGRKGVMDMGHLYSNYKTEVFLNNDKSHH